MKYKYLFTLLPIILTTACTTNNISDSSSLISSENSSLISEESTSEDGSSFISSSTTTVSSSDEQSSSNNSSSTNSSSNSSSNNSSTSTSSTSSSESQKEKYTLEDWTTWSFYDDYGGNYHPDWPYYYGDSFNPNGCLFKCPNEKAEGDGIEFFDKKQYMTSPSFKGWNKIEIYFSLWFSSRTSSKYKSIDGQPQLIVEEYTLSGSKIGTTNIFLTKDKVPTTGHCYDYHFYIRESNMSYYVIKYNNSIANGDSGYTIVMHEIRMKGWIYD